MKLELMPELLLAIKELVLEFDAVTQSDNWGSACGHDCDGSVFYENEVEDLRELIEKIEGRPWEELVEQAKARPTIFCERIGV